MLFHKAVLASEIRDLLCMALAIVIRLAFTSHCYGLGNRHGLTLFSNCSMLEPVIPCAAECMFKILRCDLEMGCSPGNTDISGTYFATMVVHLCENVMGLYFRQKLLTLTYFLYLILISIHDKISR